MTKTRILSLLCLTGVAWQLWAAEPPGSLPASTPDNSNQTQTVSPADLQKLKERIAQQEEEIKKLQKSVEEQQQLLNSAIQSAATATAKAAAPGSIAPANGSAPATLEPVSNVSHPGLAPAGRWQKAVMDQQPPLSFSIGNTTFSPLGFVDFTFFTRTTQTTSGIGTGFGGIPFNNTVAGNTSELNMSLQNSRLGFRVDSKFMGYKILGYVETDFLGNQPTGIYVTSNADVLRMRNVFVDLQKNGFEILGGQDWSLATPNRIGLSPLPSDIFYTQNMDTNYQAGLVWARQPQLRLIAHPSDNFAFGVSLENPEQYTNTYVTFPSAYSTTLGNEFNNNTNTYSATNTMPDVIVKAAYDGHAGDKIEHIEAGGIVRTLKDTLPVPSTSTNFQTNHIVEASGMVNGNFELLKGFHLIANTFFGAGDGRYVGTGLGPDVIVHANGTLSPVHSYSTVDGFEANLGKRDLISVLYGGAYFSRNTAIDATGKVIGFGFAGSTDNRNIQEITFDYQHTFWKNPSYGAITLITQYSYLLRDPWSISAGQNNAHTNMVWLDLRYTLP